MTLDSRHSLVFVTDNYTPAAQKEPLLRPKEVDVEDEIDDEPLLQDGGEIVSESPPRELSSLELELQNAPRRKQRFILQNALKIRNIESEGRPRKQVRFHPTRLCNAFCTSTRKFLF